jgi:hypothetical protein
MSCGADLSADDAMVEWLEGHADEHPREVRVYCANRRAAHERAACARHVGKADARYVSLTSFEAARVLACQVRRYPTPRPSARVAADAKGGAGLKRAERTVAVFVGATMTADDTAELRGADAAQTGHAILRPGGTVATIETAVARRS